MAPFLMVTAVQCHDAHVPCLIAEAAVIPADTARAILAALQAERDVADVAHQEGFDSLIDNIERALGEPHACAMRALALEETRT